MYICEYCGKEFDNCYKLGGHKIHCKSNPNYNKSIEQLSEARKHIKDCTFKNEELSCQYCGKIVHNKGCLVLHERHCEKNPERIPCNGNYGKTKGMSHIPWNKGLTAADDERVKKGRDKRHQTYLNGELKLFEQHSSETKKILREKAINYIKQSSGCCTPRYSKKSIEYIKKLNEVNHWNLQHAENGGEYEVDGYFLDGYDKELNIAFEYDEKRHYSDPVNNILNKRDIERQTSIINKLGCKFYRYNEYLDYFYCVN